VIADSRPLSDLELKDRELAAMKIVELERLNSLDMRQKSRIKWLVDGDENSHFFHGFINNRNNKNQLHALLINGDWCIDPTFIKDEAVRFFTSKFSEKWKSRPKFQSSDFQKLSEANRVFIEAPFSIEEVRVAVWSCGNEKALGPDGFTFKFFKKFWDLLKDDIMAFVHHFEKWGRFSRGCNSSFITLAAKIKDPLNLGDSRPISLIGLLYKIIAKLLALRIKKVVGVCIDDTQSAYIEGRNILEGPFVINELCSWAKLRGRKRLLFKADFNQAFDSVNWNYLDSIMAQMNFGEKWRAWIRVCLESSRASVLINGSPTKEFSMQKGVRQGDPLYHFLFIIAMEGLNLAMKAAISKGVFHGISIPNSSITLSHLFYADDALFVGDWSKGNIVNLARILICFYVVFGLKVNFCKSRVIGVGVPLVEVDRWASPLGCEPSTLPFNYLGVPVGANMNLKKSWKPILDKFNYKLSVWKSKNLSFGGRITLAKVVLGSLPIFYLSIFAAPVGVVESLEKIRRKFVWGGSRTSSAINWVAWERIMAPKSVGGLGLGIRALNLALLCKWWWRLKKDQSSIWARTIHGIHNIEFS